MPKSISFQDALRKSSDRKILLLGNGFSIAAHDSFNYKNLYDEVSEDMETYMPEVYSIFESSNKDFEKVINSLGIASKVLRHYGKDNLADEIDGHRKQLAEVLIETVSNVHPEQRYVLPQNKAVECQKFLSHFIGEKDKEGTVYTLNYDLLLYWVLMNTPSNDSNNAKITFSDGFGLGDGKTWEHKAYQNIFFLHGNFCLYKDPNSNHIGKLIHGGIAGSDILTQVRALISNGRFPLFVSDGSGEDKLIKIQDNAYLEFCSDNLKDAVEDPDVSLFIFGCSLDSSDEHIRKVILKKSKCKVFIGTYGTEDKALQARCKLHGDEDVPIGINAWSEVPSPRFKFFCAESANVWGENGNLGQVSGGPPLCPQTWPHEEFSDF